MLKTTYKSYFDKINPTNDLIERTKAKMVQEKTKKHFSFYKYSGLIAACFIVILATTVLKFIASDFSNSSLNSYDAIQNSDSITNYNSSNKAMEESITSNFATDQVIENEARENSFANKSGISSDSFTGVNNPFAQHSDLSNSEITNAVTKTSEPLLVKILLFPFRLIKKVFEIIFQ